MPFNADQRRNFMNKNTPKGPSKEKKLSMDYILRYLKTKLVEPGKTLEDFKRLVPFMLKKSYEQPEVCRTYYDDNYAGILYTGKDLGRPEPYIILFEANPFKLVGEKLFDKDSIEAKRVFFSNMPWKLTPLDVLNNIDKQRNAEYLKFKEEEKARRQKNAADKESEEKARADEIERKKQEVHTLGNLKYNILSERTEGRRFAEDHYMTIKVLDGATEEDVINAFDPGNKNPLIEIRQSNDNPTIFEIREYHD
jgi:hypothetical protein